MAVVGLGFGAVHVAAFRNEPRTEVVALCGRDVGRVRDACARLGVRDAVVDFRDLLEPGFADVIAFAVPAPVQVELGRAALASDKHVFFEKPLALRADVARGLHDLAMRRGLKTAINFEFPESAAWQEAKRIVQEGRLGALRHVALTWRIETFANKLRLDDSWKTRSSEGGGALNLFTSHVLFNLEWLFGPIHALFARIERAPSDTRATDTLNVLHLTTHAGLSVTVQVAIDAFMGTGHRLEVCGDSGTLIVENTGTDYVNGFQVALAMRADTALQSVPLSEVSRAGEDGRIAATSGIVRRFVDAISGTGSGPFPGAAEGARVAELAQAAMLSQTERRVVEIGSTATLGERNDT